MSTAELIETGAAVISTADSATSIIDNPTPINITSSSGQIISAYFSRIPGATIAIAPAAAVITTGKIIVDAKEGQKISAGDIISVTGNVVSVIAAVGLLAGAPITVSAMALGVGLTT